MPPPRLREERSDNDNPVRACHASLSSADNQHVVEPASGGLPPRRGLSPKNATGSTRPLLSAG